jgi:hypothetical protein
MTLPASAQLDIARRLFECWRLVTRGWTLADLASAQEKMRRSFEDHQWVSLTRRERRAWEGHSRDEE